jgi:hypothetical protein
MASQLFAMERLDRLHHPAQFDPSVRRLIDE